MDGYDYADWLSCPECDSSEVYVETIKSRNTNRPPNTDQLQLWLRFHCQSCDYRSRDFDAEKVMPEF